MRQAQMKKGAMVLSGARVMGDVVLGEDSSVWYNAVVRGDLCSIAVGKRTNIQDCCVLHTDRDCPLLIGDDVTVGHACILHGCTIGNNVLVGQGSIVMNGAVLEDGCVLGAGSLVPSGKVIPSGTVAFGRPARVVRTLSDEEQAENLQRAERYVRAAREHSAQDM